MCLHNVLRYVRLWQRGAVSNSRPVTSLTHRRCQEHPMINGKNKNESGNTQGLRLRTREDGLHAQPSKAKPATRHRRRASSQRRKHDPAAAIMEDFCDSSRYLTIIYHTVLTLTGPLEAHAMSAVEGGAVSTFVISKWPALYFTSVFGRGKCVLAGPSAQPAVSIHEQPAHHEGGNVVGETEPWQ